MMDNGNRTEEMASVRLSSARTNITKGLSSKDSKAELDLNTSEMEINIKANTLRINSAERVNIIGAMGPFTKANLNMVAAMVEVYGDQRVILAIFMRGNI